MVKITNDITWWCKLLGKEISEDACYDINIVREGFISLSVLETEAPTVDIEKAKKVCVSCEHQQL
ncbi:MAG: hypothetical protein FD169_1138 [Bacillota bacterium]|nr:MAG: hypothetical protein FD169_1138 [Bacillota bacterium]MBS3949944.1 hypothetical protein [Peptococcaceae bacterium]